MAKHRFNLNANNKYLLCKCSFLKMKMKIDNSEFDVINIILFIKLASSSRKKLFFKRRIIKNTLSEMLLTTTATNFLNK